MTIAKFQLEATEPECILLEMATRDRVGRVIPTVWKESEAIKLRKQNKQERREHVRIDPPKPAKVVPVVLPDDERGTLAKWLLSLRGEQKVGHRKVYMLLRHERTVDGVKLYRIDTVNTARRKLAPHAQISDRVVHLFEPQPGWAA